MPASVIAHKQKLANMSDKEFSEKYGHKPEKELRDMAARHGYGWNREAKTGSDHYVKRLSAMQKEETLEELKKTTLRSYRKQAQHDLGDIKSFKKHPENYPAATSDDIKSAGRREKTREAGLRMVAKKLKK